MAAVGYIRRSKADEAQVSRSTQEETVRRLAAQEGVTLREPLLVDWGRSGGKAGREGRKAYRQLLTEAEEGSIDAVFVYDQDRLARDVLYCQLLLEAADEYGFPVWTDNMGDIARPDSRFAVQVRAASDENEYRKIEKRNQKTVAFCRERGDDFGSPPLGHVKQRAQDGSGRVEIVKTDPDAIERVIEAYREAGTYNGAARVLNAADIPVARPGWKRSDGASPRWAASSVRRVIQREAPGLISDDVRQGTSGPGRPRLFAKLLRCYCGGPMTPSGKLMPDGTLRKPKYYCARAVRDPNHGNPQSISERKLLLWMEQEAGRFRGPEKVIVPGHEYDDGADRAALEALRGKVSDAVIDAGLADLDAKREEHGERQELVRTIPQSIDWETWSTADINRVLRSYWEFVQLDERLQPVEAVWRLPSEYIA